ncbi:hypothetical protein QA640_46990 (plasmid) [Bradyrhizobium sp. CB82]|uniref:hypothetical protein n=1 Tax=Bradyrhizobium sp. CB82 TaxID=3039159 RepID=UPI0024B1BC51|nr:hypothetical protein [Bradyrhizobium sp. CB82]WFU46149.1 hypothetical protein QA640_46990 [Bradyrhizobium sp. CB82]
MPFSVATGATDAARAGPNVMKLIDTIAVTIHRTPVPGFCKGHSSGWPVIPAHIVVKARTLAGCAVETE